ncbi:hypothetical protein Poly30_47040 [Planctomycetes bacterium Poly30]|uniref:Uncharacterized protein n=1 Tax=Saltatorellus ferox TaxID=2528018 RepID=A0A518EYI2_9BACT|nr:hypothetical protein Poly30_47040 [Planctomycetes bacterium Poly30]
MSHFLRLASTFALSALALVASGFSDDGIPVKCTGCTFTQVGPANGNTGGANPCGADIRITIMSFNGSCALAENVCQQASPCFAGIQVEYRSLCPVTLDYLAGPNGGMQGSLPLPPTAGGAWTDVIPPWLETLACGSPTHILHALITDPTGRRAWSTANYWCNACD